MKLLVTDDGTHTLLSEDLNVTYHSKFGALQESAHIFINNGLDYYVKKNNATSVSVFELGFGTGLNAILSMRYAATNPVKVEYFALDNKVVDEPVWQQLNYGTALAMEKEFAEMHSLDWGHKDSKWSNFYIQKLACDFVAFETAEKFDIVYYHPFTPNAQPELWTKEIFEKLKGMLKPNAMIVTFCCKGTVQRMLAELGFEIELPVGPPGKREILRATLIA